MPSANFPCLPYPEYCPDCGNSIPTGESCPCYAGSLPSALAASQAERPAVKEDKA
jgi:hypothetical protein